MRKNFVSIGAVTSILFAELAFAATTVSSYPPQIVSGVIETYDAWMTRVVPLALPAAYGAVGPINPDFSAVTAFPIPAPPYARLAPPQFFSGNPAPIPVGAPILTFTKGPGVTELGVSNIGTNGGKVQFVSDLSVGNGMNWSDIDVEFSGPLTAIGFGVQSYHDSSVSSYGDSSFSVTLYDLNNINVGSGNFVAPSIPLLSIIGAFEPNVMPGFTFVGVTSTIPFVRMEIRESKTYPTGGIQNSSLGGGVADRESFGAFFAGGPLITATPQCLGPNKNASDSDGDGLLDCWETEGIFAIINGNPVKVLDLPAMGAKVDHKDIFVEIDWMDLHKPDPTAVQDVIASFAKAPVVNPDGLPGIALHITVDEKAIAHNNNLAFAGCTATAPLGTPDFDSVKSTYFGTAAERISGISVDTLKAKRLVFHYALYVHSLLGLGTTSGCGELPGNDFVVSLGGWAVMGGHDTGDVNQQSGTLMHELGHNLNLRHGGGDNINFKPNYLSVMSYTRQINLVLVNRLLDYSPQALLTLNETSLDEIAGIGLPLVSPTQTAFSYIDFSKGLCFLRGFVPAGGPINWNFPLNSTYENPVTADINSLGRNSLGQCIVDGYGILRGYDDWANIFYDFRVTTDFADGIHRSAPQTVEVDFSTLVRISPDTDGDGIANALDNCPLTSNADQKDSNGNGVGDACEGDLDHDGDIDQDDLDRLLAKRNTPASGPNDPMDLDGDGRITALDARMLILKCTRPRCATH